MGKHKESAAACCWQVKEKPKLSAEEARKQAEEVLRKAKEKREVRGSALAPRSQSAESSGPKKGNHTLAWLL